MQIPLIPLIEKKAINTKNIIIDSKSGYSGAGKNIKKKFKFKNLFNSVSAYKVGSHRHMVEIDQQLSKISKKKNYCKAEEYHQKYFQKKIVNDIGFNKLA